MGTVGVVRTIMCALAGVVALLVASSTPAAPRMTTATNLVAHLGVSPTPVAADRGIAPTPNGGTKAVSSLRFYAMPQVQNAGPDAATFRMRFELGAGLRFTTGIPDVDAANCTATDTVAECRVTEPLPAEGSPTAGWQFQIEAAFQPGNYTMTVELFDLSTTDADPSDNRTTITVGVTETSGGGSGGSGGGGGGGTVSVSASTAKLTPSKPKAGSAVTASVRVRAGGAAVRPTQVSCSGSIGPAKLKGTGRATSGTASCTFRTPRTAKGKTLAGAVSFRARGKAFTKRFSTRLG